MDKQTEPTVPKRKDPKKVEVYARSRAFELAGRDPGCKYQWMSKDPSNPSFYGKFTRKHEVGNAATGFATADAWEFVSSTDGVRPVVRAMTRASRLIRLCTTATWFS